MSKDDVEKVVEKPETGLFNFFWSATDATIKGIKKPFKVSALKRGFRSAYDDASVKIIDLETKIDNYRKELTTTDINTESSNTLNKIFECKMEIRCLKEQQKDVLDEYTVMFDKEMSVKEED
jgi:hypothetical protein